MPLVASEHLDLVVSANYFGWEGSSMNIDTACLFSVGYITTDLLKADSTTRLQEAPLLLACPLGQVSLSLKQNPCLLSKSHDG